MTWIPLSLKVIFHILYGGDFIDIFFKTDEEKKTSAEKQKEMLMPLAGFLIAITVLITIKAIVVSPLWAWLLDLADKMLTKAADYFNEINSLPQAAFIAKGILDIFDAILGFGMTMHVFMVLYAIGRRGIEPLMYTFGEKIHESFEFPFRIYVMDEENGDYILSKRGEVLKRYITLIVFCYSIILIIIYFMDTAQTGALWNFESGQVLPLIIISVFMEIYQLLDCADPVDSSYAVGRNTCGMGTEDIMSKLRAVYKRYAADKNITYTDDFIRGRSFPDRILVNTTMQSPYSSYLKSYIRKKSKSRSYSEQAKDAAFRLLNGQNLFMATPFYKDIDICIFFLAYIRLLEGGKVLILSEDNGNLSELVKWMKGGIEEVSDMIDLFSVEILDKTAVQADIGILPFQSIYRCEEIDGMKLFAKNISFVVILEASDLLASGQEAVSFFASNIGITKKQCTWLLCDRNAESMLDLFSHLLHTEFLYVSATPQRAEKAAMGYWSIETETPQIWEPVERFLGLEAGIIENAVKNGISFIDWFGDEAMPVFDYQWLWGQYYAAYGKRTNQNAGQTTINNQINFYVSGIHTNIKKERFIIVEDSICNLYETGYQYATRAEKNVYVHVLSPRYLFRDFMKNRSDTMQEDVKYIAQFVPEYVNSSRNIALRMIRKMLAEPVSETELEMAFNENEEKRKYSISLNMIQDFIKKVFEVPSADIAISHKNTYSEKTRNIIQESFYQIVDERVVQKFSKYFQQAYYIDEKGDRRYINRMILAGHLEQKYLPGQYITLEGKYYEIINYITTDYEKNLLVRRASEQAIKRRYYRQKRNYEIKDPGDDYNFLETNFYQQKLKVRRCLANITARTEGYMSMDSWNNICDGIYIACPAENLETREYCQKELLKVEFTGKGKEDPLTVLSIAILFQESFCTFYPQYCHLLSVAIEQQNYKTVGMDEKILETVLADVKVPSNENSSFYGFYILEDSKEDMGLLRSIERNFQRILNILLTYSQWSKTSNDDYLKFGGQ